MPGVWRASMLHAYEQHVSLTLLGHHDANGARAAAHVQEHRVGPGGGPLADQLVQHARGRRVDLRRARWQVWVVGMQIPSCMCNCPGALALQRKRSTSSEL